MLRRNNFLVDGYSRNPPTVGSYSTRPRLARRCSAPDDAGNDAQTRRIDGECLGVALEVEHRNLVPLATVHGRRPAHRGDLPESDLSAGVLEFDVGNDISVPLPVPRRLQALHLPDGRRALPEEPFGPLLLDGKGEREETDQGSDPQRQAHAQPADAPEFEPHQEDHRRGKQERPYDHPPDSGSVLCKERRRSAQLTGGRGLQFGGKNRPPPKSRPSGALPLMGYSPK